MSRSRLSPPPLDYMDTISSSTGNEIFIDDIDEMPVSQRGQGKYSLKQHQHERNPCKQILRFIRSKDILIFCKRRFFLFVLLKNFGQHNNRKKLIVKKIWKNMHEQLFVN